MGKIRSFLKSLIEKRKYAETDDYWYFPFQTPSFSGVAVDESTAFKNPAVWACVRVISETIASLPLFVYRRLPGGGKEKVTDHPYHKLLHVQPNEQMTAFQWREVMMSHILTWGNHYSYLDWARNNTLLSIEPLRPDRMEVMSKGDRLKYLYRPPDSTEQVVFDQDYILHIPGLGYNGIVGYSVITAAREAIGVSMAAEELSARFFSNDATPPTVLKHPQRLSNEVHERLKTSWENAHGGLGNKWRPAILEEGMDITSVGVPYKDSQFLETRKFQTAEICRFFPVPPHMIQDLDRATFSNIEQQSLDFVVNTIRPWLVRLEQAFLVKLFTDKRTYFVEHVVDGLLRGDIASRYQAYSIGRQWGWLSADDVRELENMNPLPNGQGKIYYAPLNMVPADKFEEITTRKPEPVKMEEPVKKDDEEDKEEVEEEKRQLITQVINLKTEGVDRIIQDSVRAAVQLELYNITKVVNESTGIEKFESSIDDFYGWARDAMVDCISPAVSAYSILIGSTVKAKAYVESYVTDHIKESRNEISKWAGLYLHESTDGFKRDDGGIESCLGGWVDSRPIIASESIVKLFNSTQGRPTT